MSAIKLSEVIKTVRWNGSLSTQDTESTQAPVDTMMKHAIAIEPPTPVQIKTSSSSLDRLKKAFLLDLPVFLEGKSIAQSFAGPKKHNVSQHVGGPNTSVSVVSNRPPRERNNWTDANPDSSGYALARREATDDDITQIPHETPFHIYGSHVALSASERVVRSHLRHLNEFEPFRKGLFSQSVLYEFLFYMIVEKGRRESYTKRVIRSIMAYLQAGGALAIDNLSVESKNYIENFRGLGGIKFSTFYRRMDALTNTLGDDQTKRLLSSARCKRALVFDDVEESRILQHCVRVLRASIRKYVTDNNRVSSGKRLWSTYVDHHSSNVETNQSPDTKIEINTDAKATDTRPGRLNYERAIFEFAFAYVLGFLSGARIKSTVLKFSVDDVKTLLAGGRLEVLTKGVFVNVFLPISVLNEDAEIYGQIMALRMHSMLYRQNMEGKRHERKSKMEISHNDYDSSNSSSENEDQCSIRKGFTYQKKCNTPSCGVGNRFFTCSSRQLELMLDRVYHSLFSSKKRAKGVRWHSQRRKYLGTINAKYGAPTASESVGHRDLSTTMTYINNSLHMDDVRTRAGEAITERYNMILTK
jgi:hypothetical protein